MAISDIPFGAQFSPNQIDLPRLLSLCEEHQGNRKELEAAIQREFFSTKGGDAYNQAKLANNTALGMIAYGVIDRKGTLTDLGKELLLLQDNPPQLYKRFAQHILLKLRGLDLVQTAQDMQARGERYDLVKFRQWLEERGIHIPRGAVHMSSMRLWLEKAGLVTSTDWQIDYSRLESLLGVGTTEIDTLAMLTPEQKAYIKTISNIPAKGSYPANEIERLATQLYGVKYNEKMLPKQILYPLQDIGYIEITKPTGGRGAKPFLVKPTEKVKSELIAPLLEALEKQAASDLRPLLRKPLGDILKDLTHRNKHIKGLALEALAFYLMRLIDLNYIATRLRGQATGGAEVDLIFEGTRFIFSRWQIQCKNTPTVSLDDVAKEVGLTHQLKSNVVMVVSTGSIGEEARKFSHHVMNTTNLDIILVDRTDLEKIKQNPM
ncbi:MAG: restriction endonuclease, partial [Candidatus Omnitrophica bacterium]|nr:restriction endonuclease [Candidatus Omnitrophota bacterium]